jgi:hypothetical protein
MNINNLEAHFLHNTKTPSDINEHLPTLLKFAKECKTIVEFGVRDVVSSFAFALAKPEKLTCIDIEKSIYVDPFMELCRNENVNVEFKKESSLDIQIDNADLIFIDTVHNYDQLKTELALHGNKSNKYLIFHDTITFGNKNETEAPGEKQGLVPAIAEFLDENMHWSELYTYTNNNGLTILVRNNEQ